MSKPTPTSIVELMAQAARRLKATVDVESRTLQGLVGKAKRNTSPYTFSADCHTYWDPWGCSDDALELQLSIGINVEFEPGRKISTYVYDWVDEKEMAHASEIFRHPDGLQMLRWTIIQTAAKC